MISVARIAEPRELMRNKATWLRALNAASTAAEMQNAEKKYRHKAIKDALVAMFCGKCAYCESKILHVSFGDIEHFRPKSNPQYRPLIFEWSNLMLSCSVCNGAEYKGTKFPELNAYGPIVNPTTENPLLHLSFIYDPIAQLATVAYRTPRGRTTRDILGLNRPQLREHRSKVVKRLKVIALCAPTDPVAQALLDEAKEGCSEFAAFARSL